MDVGLSPMFNGAGGSNSDLDQKRKSLAQRLAAQAQRTAPLFGGLRGGAHSASESPTAALPKVSFNPFAAQQRAGILNLAGPTQTGVPDTAQLPATTSVSDLTGGAAPAPAPANPAAVYTGSAGAGGTADVLSGASPRRILIGEQQGDPNAGFYGSAQPDPTDPFGGMNLSRLQQQLIQRQMLLS